jgi:aminoglycoside phosphotransferase family enzyme/predicted kinase
MLGTDASSVATETDPAQVRRAVAQISPAGVETTVETRETHISWLFLTGDRAYKLKKPLVLPFLDYGTPRRRREMCWAEVRLNRRLGGDVYLGVRGIARTPAGFELVDDDDARAIDYVVEMRRYDEQSVLSAVLGRGELTDSQITDLARTLASFHAGCARIRGGADRGAEAVQREVDRNVRDVLEDVQPSSRRERILALSRFMNAFVASRRAELNERAARGCARECHGDLRAEHVLLGPAIRVVDCVEFDVGLRTLDVSDDLAFLVMDLAALGGEHYTRGLVDAYRAAGGDCGSDALLAFFAVHRALVRAKVMLVRAGQHAPESDRRRHASAAAEALLALAQRFAWQARGPLAIVICGVPASGKSSLAATLSAGSGLPKVSSDVVRKQLAGLAPQERGSPELYAPDFDTRTYAELGRRAGDELRSRAGVIVDATFRHRRDRDAFYDAFGEAAPLLFVRCEAPAHVLARRAETREYDPARVSDADLEVVLRERAAWEPLDEVPADACLTLRTDRDVEATLTDLTALVDQRGRQ